MRCHSPIRRTGTTLTEILVVIALITTLSTMSFLSFTAAQRFTQRIESEAARAIAKVRGDKLPEEPTTVTQETPTTPRARPERVPGHYYVGFAASVKDPHAEAQRLAKLAGGQVLGIYTNGIFGFGLQCFDASKVTQLVLDPAVKKVDQARCVYPAQASANVPMNIKRVHSNGIMGNPTRWNLTTANTMYGLPGSIYQFPWGSRAQPTVRISSRVFLPAGSATPGTTVAIMDTGVDYTHPDLNVLTALDFTGGNNPMDTDGHGTHVAGVVGAIDQTASGGVIGVYPGAPIISLKVMSSIPLTGTAIQSVFVDTSGGFMPTFVNALRVRSNGHGLNTGDTITISGVVEPPFTPSVNGTWTVTRISAGKGSSNEFWINGTNGTTPTTGVSTPNTGNFVEAGKVVNDKLQGGSALAVYDALSNYVIPNASAIGICLMPFETGVDPEMNALVDEAANKGVLMVAAAGNNKVNTRTNISPASASQCIAVGAFIDSNGLPGGSAVSATTGDDTFTYTNTGADIYAPGGDQPGSTTNFYRIRSTVPLAGALQFGLATPYSTGIYGNPLASSLAFGTSFSAAHVAGMMAMMRDPQSQIGFVVGSRAVPTYSLQMTNRASALASLISLTHRTETIQMINPRTNSMWQRITIPGTSVARIVPFTISFYDDRIGGQPVANFYVNTGDPRSAISATSFPGDTR